MAQENKIQFYVLYDIVYHVTTLWVQLFIPTVKITPKNPGTIGSVNDSPATIIVPVLVVGAGAFVAIALSLLVCVLRGR